MVTNTYQASYKLVNIRKFNLISHYYTIVLVFERFNVLLSQAADPGLCVRGEQISARGLGN